ncbi:MAG TPA: hypothetical protein PLL30_06460 [Candidatus Krumholzibacteria bacterium]|nr:hypothetical protein [Candidatus Krumholzibacteria bacterium]HPD71403.1 hypothetical protein [Candidatus Krumholzibacteria bacterium]HRY41664.1 hypothetical protein [Candidatus Krumholzibacteria bacterium]
MVRRRLAIGIGALLLVGCSRPDLPEPAACEHAGAWPAGLTAWLGVPDGQWQWTWSRPDGVSGAGVLTSDGSSFRWDLAGTGGQHAIALAPDDPRWLPLQVSTGSVLAGTPPLPCLAVDSTAYPDLVSMLRELITPRFGGVVTHWHGEPVPVRSPAAASGDIDLAACLREAVDLWNAGEPSPLFVWQPDSDWGVQLAHYPGSIRHPPMEIQLTRRDADGSPLCMRIAVGDNYRDAAVRPYVVRRLAHELAHALLLWGHSPDRLHLLWGDAPPLRSDPSTDERRAIALLRRLPAGLDLARYGSADPPRGSTSRHGISASGRPSSSGNASASPAR